MGNPKDHLVINAERVVFMAPSGLVRLIDKAAAAKFEGRSSFIRNVLAAYLGLTAVNGLKSGAGKSETNNAQ